MILAPTILDRLLDPIFTPDVARRFVDFRLSPEFETRLQELREGANEGTLSEDERAEYEQLVEGLDLLAMMKLRARAALDRNGK